MQKEPESLNEHVTGGPMGSVSRSKSSALATEMSSFISLGR